MMLQFQEILLTGFSLLLIGFFVSFFTYYFIYKSSKDYLSFLHIPADKSHSNAKLLGGLGVALGTIAVISYLSLIQNQFSNISFTDIMYMKLSIISLVLIAISGYIDDRFELRARYKLLFQLIAISTFSFVTYKDISSTHNILVFILSMGLGILLINGTNLLDGLDTMTIKLGIVTSLAFASLALFSGSTIVFYLSVSTIGALSSFYFFNREPAKIYMGEIGGSLIGFIFYIQATMSYKSLIQFNNGYKSIALVLIACSLPLCELGISFFRRLIMKKSPFRGDKLHLHHILKSKYKLSASKTSSFMAIGYTMMFSLGFTAALRLEPQIGLLISVATITSVYTLICYNDWNQTQSNDKLSNLFLYFENKPVHVIDSDTLKSVSVLVIQTKIASKSKKRAA